MHKLAARGKHSIAAPKQTLFHISAPTYVRDRGKLIYNFDQAQLCIPNRCSSTAVLYDWIKPVFQEVELVFGLLADPFSRYVRRWHSDCSQVSFVPITDPLGREDA